MHTYLIIPVDSPPFYTNYYDHDNHYSKGMIVFNRITHEYTTNGTDWLPIEEDHL